SLCCAIDSRNVRMTKRIPRKALNLVPTALAVATALLYLSSNGYSASQRSGPVLRAATKLVAPNSAMVGSAITATMTGAAKPGSRNDEAEARTARAIDVLKPAVRQLSHPDALRDAFQSYFTFASEHPDQVRKPYLYFVDYGLSSITPRGYVFDMSTLKIVDGPFMVAQGRGSATNARGIPTHFSNAFGAATTSLGLYVAQELYKFTGHAGGEAYHSIGLRLAGVSGGFNDNARARGVVAHGAPYVTDTRAGRSEGCPAMAPARARELLPKLASGGLVFLFAPDSNWMSHDPWLSAD
ncbi:MAG TPA: murein L,D-transpeptidase catalytic domain family protein, partial [Gemmatimonadaceae bacterium]